MITPGPGGGGLTVAVECGARPPGGSADTHLATVHPDWTVTTPHDLEAERIAQALGGWSGCLHFVDAIVPALRHALTLMHDPALLDRDADGNWLNTPTRCRHGRHRHRSLRDAMRHEISPVHLHGPFGATPWWIPGRGGVAWPHFCRLIWVARDAWAASADPPQGLSDAATFWRAGLLPSQVQRAAAVAPDLSFPPPPELIIDIHYEHAARRGGPH